MAAPWRITLLGELRAERGDLVVTRFRTQKTASLLAYLAYHGDRTHSREMLAELLWPEEDPESSRHRLSVALSALRQQLEPSGTPLGSVLISGRIAAGLDFAAVRTDVTEFEAGLENATEAAGVKDQAAALALAVDLYRGELLPGFYEEWIEPERQRLADRCLRALRELAAGLEALGEPGRALDYLRRAAALDPLREETVRELMRLCAARGEPAAALRSYRELERRLRDEVGIQPSAATRELAEAGESGSAEAWKRERADVDPARPFAGAGVPAKRVVAASTRPSEPPGGAVPLDSPYYVVRDTDAEFHRALARGDSIVLLKGAHQVGKTSLLARGLQEARIARPPARVARSDCALLTAEQHRSAETLLRALAEELAEQLELKARPGDGWDAHRGPNANFTRFLRREALERWSDGVMECWSSGDPDRSAQSLPDSTTPSLHGSTAPLLPRRPALVWGMDDLDRLFTCDFGAEILALFRSWHNERALDPEGPWSRLTLAITYATEAHLFVTDLNQSPFNVGTRLALEDFNEEQVSELNRRHGAPLKSEAEVARLIALVGGHPYLVRRGLHELAKRGTSFAAFEARASDPDGVYGDHLQRLLALLAHVPALREAVRAVLQGRPCPSEESFYRLRTAGVLAGDSERSPRPRCALYARYLDRHLPG